MSDDEFEALRPRQLPADLQSWNIEDLQAYINRLEAEIALVKAKMAEKESVGNAAAALFKNSK
ncbi:MAG: DUF1192 domain-containing protein [Candidatus Puniceispirillaceae bacterium]